jgi:hypothetical protein
MDVAVIRKSVALFLFVGSVFGLTFWSQVICDHGDYMEKNGVVSSGAVIDVREDWVDFLPRRSRWQWRRDPTRHFDVTYTYTAAPATPEAGGNIYTYTRRDVEYSAPKIGSVIAVRYDPANPADASIYDGSTPFFHSELTYRASVLLFFVGIGLCLVGLLIWALNGLAR